MGNENINDVLAGVSISERKVTPPKCSKKSK